MAEVHEGTVTWASAWEVTGGNIELSIEKSAGWTKSRIKPL
jgi:hypothetical protein